MKKVALFIGSLTFAGSVYAATVKYVSAENLVRIYTEVSPAQAERIAGAYLETIKDLRPSVVNGIACNFPGSTTPLIITVAHGNSNESLHQNPSMGKALFLSNEPMSANDIYRLINEPWWIGPFIKKETKDNAGNNVPVCNTFANTSITMEEKPGCHTGICPITTSTVDFIAEINDTLKVAIKDKTYLDVAAFWNTVEGLIEQK